MRNEYLKRLTLLFMILGLAGLSVGCATNRSVVQLQVPEAKDNKQAVNKSAYIRKVADMRVFEEAPSDPSIPSYGWAAAESKDKIKEQKKSIARKRNTYGKAMGDIVLDGEETVETVIAKTLRSALISNGFRIIEKDKDVIENTLLLDVDIDKFWAWFRPGFWAITLSSDISTKIRGYSNINRELFQKSVGAHSSQSNAAATDGNWIELYQNALLNYYNEAVKQLGVSE